MKRKGFTLVELLAVIAILAILVIIALPNVMGMFNTAKENSFKTEIKEIYKTAQNQWMQDSMFKNDERVYTRCSGCTGKSLDLSGRSELEYYIKVNKSGKIVEYYATDGTFQYSFSDPDGLKVENITSVQKIADINNEEEKVKITNSGVNGNTPTVRYVYVTDGNIGTSLADIQGQYSDNYQDIMDIVARGSHKDFFLRATVDNDNRIVGQDVGFVINGTPYYLLGVDPSKYNQNKALLNSLSSYFSCVDTSSEWISEFTKCVPKEGTNLLIDLEYDPTGRVTVGDTQSGWYCVAHSNGKAFCFDE